MKEYLNGEYCYDKKLKTLNHCYDFLAGFLVGMIDTDGSKREITLANKQLIDQLSVIFKMFGVICSYRTYGERYSKFINKVINYHHLYFLTPIPDSILPKLERKRDQFAEDRKTKDKFYRYPFEVTRPIARRFEELNFSNGWITLDSKRVKTSRPIGHYFQEKSQKYKCTPDKTE